MVSRDANGVGMRPDTPEAEPHPLAPGHAVLPARRNLPMDTPAPEARTPTAIEVLRALQSTHGQETTSRPSVSENPTQAMCLGMSWGRSRALADVAVATRDRPRLTELFALFGSRIPDSTFTYTCIQLNPSTLWSNVYPRTF